MATKDDKQPADKVEDEVLNTLPTLGAVELLKICELVKVTVKESQKGNRRVLVKLLMKFLCVDEDDEDDRMTEFLQIYDYLQLEEQEIDEVDDENAEEGLETQVKAKEEGSVTEDRKKIVVKEEDHGNASGVTKSKRSEKKESGAASKKTSVSKGASSLSTTRSEERVTRTIRKEFKLSGMIGGDSPSGMTFPSLKFEIAKGRKQGYEDSEMCSAIISKVADQELKDYSVNEPDI